MRGFSPELDHVARMLSEWAGLPGPVRPGSGPVDGDRCYSLLYANELTCFAGARLSEAQASDLPESITRELRADYLVQGCKAVHQALSIRRILEILDGEVEYILLKGTALVPHLYREGAERSRADIDLLLADPEAAEKANRLLRDCGFEVSRNLPHHHHLPPLVHDGEALAVELHTNLSSPPLDEQVMQLLWKRKIPDPAAGRQGRWILDPAGLLISQCVHALNDPMGSPLLRDVFEAAWTSHLLTPGQRTDLQSVLPPGPVRDDVARVQHLGQSLFGTPTVFAAPKAGWIEFWCRRKLEWVPDAGRGQRLKKRLASRVLERKRDGSSWVCLGALWEEALGQGRKVVTRDREKHYITRASKPYIHVGEAVLVLDPVSGEVHMLNDEAASIWLQIESQIPSRSLNLPGRSRRAVRQVLRVLRSKALIN